MNKKNIIQDKNIYNTLRIFNKKKINTNTVDNDVSHIIKPKIKLSFTCKDAEKSSIIKNMLHDITSEKHINNLSQNKEKKYNYTKSINYSGMKEPEDLYGELVKKYGLKIFE